MQALKIPELAGATRYDFLITDKDDETFTANIVRREGEDLFKIGERFQKPIKIVGEDQLSEVQVGRIGSYLVAQVDGNGRATGEAFYFQECDLAEFALQILYHEINSGDFELRIAERRSGLVLQ